MSMVFEHMTFNHLWGVACREGRRLGMSPELVFAGVGLRLHQPVAPWRYYCTPRNVRTFASTGCDGVHYSLLAGSRLLYSPVVMTVPMNFDNNNMIVAETLHEFLCLGSRVGYAGLEGLTTLEGDFSGLKARDYSASLTGMQAQHLRMLSEMFSLYPYVDLERRMARLQGMYLDCLQLGEMESISVRAFSTARY